MPARYAGMWKAGDELADRVREYARELLMPEEPNEGNV